MFVKYLWSQFSFSTLGLLRACARASYMMWRMALIRSLDWSIPVNFFSILGFECICDWQACEDSHWNKRTTFDSHKIVIYNPWTWKQSEDSLKISLTPKRSEFTGVLKVFLLWRETGDKIDHYISYLVFFLCEATEGAGDWRNYKLTRESNNT